ncbi:MAG: glycoside hydrolase family 127 protein, partial [Kiritimatiellae bacterium]|nr:glycoside hydrolase family 127 protein [Kiritimatiellia bacterium]
LKNNIDGSVKLLICAQREDGYIGNYKDNCHLQSWDIWGRKYTILGLTHYYDLTGDKNVLTAACRVADQLMTEVGPCATGRIHTIGMHHGMASCSVLEPVVLLYKRTQDKKYLDFAKHIANAMEMFEDSPKLVSKALAGVPVAERFPHPDPWWSWKNGIKAYEMMSCYQGLLELYQVTDNVLYLQAVEATAKNIIDDEINVAGSGAAFECWYHGKRFETAPAYHMMETCVTTTWMRLCETLLRLTGKAIYADQLEKTIYNAYLATLARDCSTFSKYCPLGGTRSRGNDQCGMTINCCVANGPRGFVALMESLLMADKDGVMVNIYHASKASILVPSTQARVTIEQETDYPRNNRVTLHITPAKESVFALRLRIPAWSARTSVTVNDMDVSGSMAGSYLVLRRTWKPGDVVKMEFDFSGRIEAKNEHFALFRGPIVLARDTRFSDGSVDQPAEMPPLGKPVEIKPVTCDNKDIWLAFTVMLKTGTDPEAEEMKQHPVHFCDYASAGNTWKSDSLYRTWFRNPMNMMARPYVSYDVPGN